MKRLFWKFFFGLFFAQFITTAVVVGLYWFKDGPHLHQSSVITEQIGDIPKTTDIQAVRHRSPRFPYRPLAVGLFTSLAFAYLLARNLSKPIEHLRIGLDEVSHGNFAYKVTPLLKGRNDELAALGRSFDETSEKLEQLLISQKQLLHDVSHELRSPLARMQIAIELLRHSPAKTEDILERLSRDTDRLNKLVGSILTLARLETSNIWDMNQEINLQELIRDVVSDVNFEAQQRGIHFKHSLPCAKLVAKGNQELLHRAIENILRNAIAFSAKNESVHIAVKKNAVDLEISVTDHGPGIPHNELSEIFNPFRRGSSSESRDGYGLGLAIAKQTLKLHRGTISAQNLSEISTKSGLIVKLNLPLQIENVVYK